MFLLNQGFIGIYSKEAIRIELLEPGDAFGLGAVLSRSLSKRIETAVAEVRSVIHSLSREALLDASASFPEVGQLMEARVVALMKTRAERDAQTAAANQKRNSLQAASGQVRSGDKHIETVTVDVFQGADLPSASDIINTSYFCRSTVIVHCSKCVAFNKLSIAEQNTAPTALPSTRSRSSKRGGLAVLASRKLSHDAITSNTHTMIGRKASTGENAREFEYGTWRCAECTVETKCTQTEAQTFDPEWNEKLEHRLELDRCNDAGELCSTYVGVYQKALVPILMGHVHIGAEAMRKPAVGWWDLRKPEKR